MQARPRAAIVYLVPLDRFGELERSLRYLAHNFNRAHQYPVLVFYDPEEQFNVTAMEMHLRPIAESSLMLVPVSDFAAPPPPRTNESILVILLLMNG